MENSVMPCAVCGADLSSTVQLVGRAISFTCSCGAMYCRPQPVGRFSYAGAPQGASAEAPDIPQPSGGGKLAGNNYYLVTVDAPISEELQPYTAECADIIEALGMTFNEGEAFKAIWRMAAARQGNGKAGNSPQYDADKVAHYGARIAAQTRKGSAK